MFPLKQYERAVQEGACAGSYKLWNYYLLEAEEFATKTAPPSSRVHAEVCALYERALVHMSKVCFFSLAFALSSAPPLPRAPYRV